jgi:protein-disulfide isomerase
VAGVLVCIGAIFPSPAFERSNKTIATLNAVGVIALLGYSVFYLGSLCLLCAGYYVFALSSFVLFWRYGIDREQRGLMSKYFNLSLKHLLSFAVITAAGAYGMAIFHETKKEAQYGSVAARVVKEFYSLPKVKTPSFVSPFMSAQATAKFEDAPIQVIEYADFLCPDCLYLYEQLARLKLDFKGKINIAFQFFPLDQCNEVAGKKKVKHPGSCDLSYIAAYNPANFPQIHDEIFGNFRAARSPEWRAQLAKKYQAEKALTDANTKQLVLKIINTGMEYEKTAADFAYGIRSTPTMIVNNRMIIGTLPYAQLKAIFQALVDEREHGTPKNFIENWEPTKK